MKHIYSDKRIKWASYCYVQMFMQVFISLVHRELPQATNGVPEEHDMYICSTNEVFHYFC